MLGGDDDTFVGFFVGTVIHAHLVVVLFRSHNNRESSPPGFASTARERSAATTLAKPSRPAKAAS